MAKNYDLSEARIYVGTYHKYNEGSLEGAWLELAGYSCVDEFWKACRELHRDESDPEFMFQDWEDIPDDMVSESWLSSNFFDIRDALKDLDGDEQEAFFIWCDDGSVNVSKKNAKKLVETFQDKYQGKYDDEVDYAYHVVKDCYDLPDFALAYFDYKSFARDIFIDRYRYVGGYVFLRR